MNRKQMQACHELQIQAMLLGDWATIHEIFPTLRTEAWCYLDVVNSHHTMWDNTGPFECSLFATLPIPPGIPYEPGCPVEIKSGHLWPGYAPERVKAQNHWNLVLGIIDNDLIPEWVDEGDEFTEEQLREFSRLQLKARFGR